MILAVPDTNTIASGAVAPAGGTLATIIDSWQAGQFGVVLSPPILGELDRTLTNSYFTSRLSVDNVAAYLTMVRATATVTPIAIDVHGIATHVEDDLMLATAVSAKVDYLVSGDNKLQKLRTFQKVTIVSPREFLDLLEDAT